LIRTKSQLAVRSIAAFAIAVLAGELFARYYLGLGTPPLYLEHPTIEYVYRPNQDVRRLGNRFLINAYGMRSESFPPHKRQGELRVMVFGDSVLNGGVLTDHAALATTLLAQKLKERTGREVTVGHISAGSWGPGNWLAYAREYGFFDADVIALVASSHDYGDNPTFAKLNELTHPTRRPVSALVEGMTRYLPRYLPSTDSNSASVDASGYAPTPTDEEARRALADLGSFLESAQQHAGAVIVFQHFEKRELGFTAPPAGYLRIKMLCDELGIAGISLAPVFKAALQRGLKPYRDNIHPTDLGQALLTHALMAELLPRVTSAAQQRTMTASRPRDRENQLIDAQ
jgi:hypothetical protein